MSMCLLLDLFFRFFYYGLFAWIILSWVQVPTTHPIGQIKVTLDTVFNRLLSPIRRYIPPLWFGGAGIDLSPLILIFGINFLRPYLYVLVCS
jgi:uncharacterized protein YggT (Ycf19 family)